MIKNCSMAYRPEICPKEKPAELAGFSFFYYRGGNTCGPLIVTAPSAVSEIATDCGKPVDTARIKANAKPANIFFFCMSIHHHFPKIDFDNNKLFPILLALCNKQQGFETTAWCL